MKHRLFFLCCLFIIECSTTVIAQPGKVTVVQCSPEKTNPPVFFERITWKEGLPRGLINMVFPDRAGYLWISNTASGIYRYDGQRYKHYPAVQPEGTGVGYFSKGFYDPDGTLWFDMDLLGLARYDAASDKIVNYPLIGESGNLNVMHTAPDQKGRIWLTASGPKTDSARIFCFDPATEQYRPYPTRNRQVRVAYGTVPTVTLPGGLWTMEADKEGQLWMGCNDGINNFLFRFDPDTDDWVAYPYPIIFTNTTIFHDDDGEWLWMTGWGKDLLGFNKNTLEWVRYAWNGRTFMGICPKSAEQLWISDYSGGGIFVFDKKQKKIWRYGENWEPDPSKRPLSGVRNGIVKDPVSGIVWEFGTDGINKIDPALQNFQQPRLTAGIPGQHFEVQTFYADTTAQILYLSGYNEKYQPFFLAYDEQRNTWRSRPFPGQRPNAGDLLLKDHRGKLLTCSYDKDTLYEIDPATFESKAISLKAENNPKSHLSSLWRGLCMPHGDLWLCGRWTGLFHLNAQRTVLHQYDPLAKNPDRPSNAEVRTAALDEKGYIWLAVYGGLVRLEPQSKTFLVFKNIPGDSLSLPSDMVATLAIDQQQRLWVGTLSGLCWVDLRKGEPCHFHRVKDATYSFLRMLIDQQGKIWGKVVEGLCCYDPEKSSCRLYDEMDGLTVEQFDRIGLSPGGEMWIDCKYRFHPAKMVYNNRPARTVLSSFKIFDKEAALPRPIEHTDTVFLNYDHNFFTLEFALLSFTQPWKNRYRYRLFGFDPAWVDADTRAYASYTNVPPGEYVFEVIGINNNGYESAQPRRLHIVIAPPWWATWWFRSFMVLVAAGIFATAWRLRDNHLRQQAAIREKELEVQRLHEEFRRRLAETEMAALRAQMNPHFIFNCLNSIQLYTRENDSETASFYLQKFSKLIRLVLENSRSEKVSLEKEMEALELYLQLEAMRFKQKVRYTIDVEADIDMEFIQIPPLLLQPFVENAVWHGLMHRPQGGSIRIRLRQPGENLLHVEIEDNGIGRAKALELKSKSALKNKSFGLQITSERLKSIHELFGVKAVVQVVDLVGPTGEAAGTKVVVEIPV